MAACDANLEEVITRTVLVLMQVMCTCTSHSMHVMQSHFGAYSRYRDEKNSVRIERRFRGTIRSPVSPHVVPSFAVACGT